MITYISVFKVPENSESCCKFKEDVVTFTVYYLKLASLTGAFIHLFTVNSAKGED